jgi:hypothetical protein
MIETVRLELSNTPHLIRADQIVPARPAAAGRRNPAQKALR